MPTYLTMKYLNIRLFNSYYLTTAEMSQNTLKVLSIRERLGDISKQLELTIPGTYHHHVIDEMSQFIGVHLNPTADHDEHRIWVNLPTKETIDLLNRLWKLVCMDATSDMNSEYRLEMLDILNKFYK